MLCVFLRVGVGKEIIAFKLEVRRDDEVLAFDLSLVTMTFNAGAEAHMIAKWVSMSVHAW